MAIAGMLGTGALAGLSEATTAAQIAHQAQMQVKKTVDGINMSIVEDNNALQGRVKRAADKIEF
ncbi:hypothetical protein C4K03_4751 [Pseudomonas synxantha]|uniref:Uncharacterized protein n=1 Tax=Pseudomonas synxantha TaxID=47883 RepID=A0A3G7UE46_9PSED|nr:hypothetical protein [Pseudomonas synxantha]AZE56889.1 hypothetical protein C4K03_4751 [Pseudomonas synxantha]